MNETAEKIRVQVLRCGFDRCGIIPISMLDGFGQLYQKRISDIPESLHFYQGAGGLDKTKERFPWAKSIVILVFDYGKFRYPGEMRGRYGKAFFLEPGKKSGARFDLEKLEAWFQENGIRAEGGEHYGSGSIGPLRYMAMKAGLGIIRKNNFFYTENGSYNNLFGYVIDEECELLQTCNIPPCSEKCDLCRKACKTKALASPYTMNPFKCVSFLTTFGNCNVPDGLTDEMYAEWVCGCDNCQDACPYNRRHDWDQGIVLPELENLAATILPENYNALTDDFLIRNVIPKTANHLQAKDISALRKNAARSAANHKTKDIIPAYKEN